MYFDAETCKGNNDCHISYFMLYFELSKLLGLSLPEREREEKKKHFQKYPDNPEKWQSRNSLQALKFEYPITQPHTLFVHDPKEIEF